MLQQLAAVVAAGPTLQEAAIDAVFATDAASAQAAMSTFARGHDQLQMQQGDMLDAAQVQLLQAGAALTIALSLSLLLLLLAAVHP